MLNEFFELTEAYISANLLVLATKASRSVRILEDVDLVEFQHGFLLEDRI